MAFSTEAKSSSGLASLVFVVVEENSTGLRRSPGAGSMFPGSVLGCFRRSMMYVYSSHSFRSFAISH